MTSRRSLPGGERRWQMADTITPTADTLLVDFVTHYYAPVRGISPRCVTYYRGCARRFGDAIGREAKVSDLPKLPQIKLSRGDTMKILALWRCAADMRLVAFDEQLPQALMDLEIASYRLAMIRNNPNARIDKPRPDMPLLDFIFCHHVTVPHHRGRVTSGSQSLYQFRRVEKLVSELLGRTAMVSDLTPHTAAIVRAAVTVKFKRNGQKICLDLWLSLWRCAAELGLVAEENLPPKRRPMIRGANMSHDGQQVKVEPVEGSLWHICLTKYFPKNLRIRSPKTQHQYWCAIRDFKEYLGHDPMPSDLSDDEIIGMMKRLLEKGLAHKTVNERRGRLRALWEWMARKRMVDEFPFVGNVKAPKRIPRAWSRSDLAKLFEACRTTRGELANGVLACDWWTALHLVLWDTGARIGEVIRCEWEWLDFETGQLFVPAEVRKGQERDMAYVLHQSTLAVLQRLRKLHRKLMFGEVRESRLYHEYRKLRERAGLPPGARNAFHKIRRSVASWLQAGGFNAADVLQHSSPDVTRNHYLDPAITGGIYPSEVLFRPLASEQPARITFAG